MLPITVQQTVEAIIARSGEITSSAGASLFWKLATT